MSEAQKPIAEPEALARMFHCERCGAERGSAREIACSADECPTLWLKARWMRKH